MTFRGVLARVSHPVEARLEGLLLEGLDSGEPVEISEAWWQKKKAELTERLQGAKKA